MATKKKRKPNAAFMKPVQPMPLWAGRRRQSNPATEVTKKLWAYIKRTACRTRRKDQHQRR
jgi:chromatin remodeling complex protein RSC6